MMSDAISLLIAAVLAFAFIGFVLHKAHSEEAPAHFNRLAMCINGCAYTVTDPNTAIMCAKMCKRMVPPE